MQVGGTPRSIKDLNDRTAARMMTKPDKPLEEAVRGVVDPGLFYSLGDLGLLRSVKTRKGRTEVVVAVPAAGHPAPHELADEVTQVVAAAEGEPATLELVNLTEAEEIELHAKLRELDSGSPAHQPGSGGHRDPPSRRLGPRRR